MPLNAKGLEQSEKLAAYMQHLPVDKIYCSSMLRACMTAAPLAMSKNMSYQPLDLLQEVSFGAGRAWSMRKSAAAGLRRWMIS